MSGASLPLHLALLNDRRRTTSFLDTIATVVRPGDVVVDVGTGTGVLALAAARAGARHVYAIEMGGIADCAEGLFGASDASDRITLVRGRSLDVRLPERADVLVCELIGHAPLAEGIVSVTADAIQRFLKPGARLVPGGVKVLGLPVSIPGEEVGRLALRDETLRKWRDWYGTDFSAMGGAAHDGFHYLNPHVARNWTPVSEPVLLADVDLRSWRTMWLRAEEAVTATRSGPVDGVVFYFELTAGPTTFFSNHPALADEDSHWHTPVRVFHRPRHVEAGERFTVVYWSLVSGATGGTMHRRPAAALGRRI